MKIRKGFVSNSSSSSYIIVGETLSFEDITLYDIKNSKIIVQGEYLSLGMDLFDLTEDLYYLIDASHTKDKFYFYRSYYEGDEGLKITDKFLNSLKPAVKTGKEVKIMTFDADYHYTESPEDFIDRYCDGDRIFLNEINGKKKIKQILKQK